MTIWHGGLVVHGAIQSGSIGTHAINSGPLALPRVLRVLLGPIWDHTIGAMMNDLRVCERLPRGTQQLPTGGDLGKCVTANYWRLWQSPETVEAWL